MSFRSPKRRLTRQRSGFTVSGSKMGSTCKFVKSASALVNSNNLVLNFKKSVNLVECFDRNLGFVAFGGYLFPSKLVSVTLHLKFVSNGFEQNTTTTLQLDPDKWKKIGTHILFDMKNLKKRNGVLTAQIKLESSNKIGKINFFGFNLDAVEEYQGKGDLWDYFQQQTNIYLPEIYYFDTEKPFAIEPIEANSMNFSNGLCITLKSCNRCDRYLIIDIDNERNVLSYSNHCTSRAPCDDPGFCKFRITENKCSSTPKVGAIKRVHYGFQLECRPCKKFNVNAPLNPLRNSTQHREDSTRRRYFENLIGPLLDQDYIYHKFRINKGKEFDRYIWEKFGKKCFNCERQISIPSDMHLDHTLPLASLWSLDETATCLCETCNSQKHDKFPVDFYNEKKLVELSKITGIPIGILKSRPVNNKVLEKLKEKVVWFFDEFLNQKDCQKIRGGKRTSDLIYKAMVDVVNRSGMELDLIKEYKKIKKRSPKSVSVT